MATHESVERREAEPEVFQRLLRASPEKHDRSLGAGISYLYFPIPRSRVISTRVRRLHYQSSPACCKHLPEPAIPYTFRLLHCCEHVYKTAFLRLTFCGMNITLYKKQSQGASKPSCCHFLQGLGCTNNDHLCKTLIRFLE